MKKVKVFNNVSGGGNLEKRVNEFLELHEIIDVKCDIKPGHASFMYAISPVISYIVTYREVEP